MARTGIARTAIAGVAATMLSLAGSGAIAGYPAFAAPAVATARDGGVGLRDDGSPAAAPRSWVKYYIVPSPAGGVTPSLRQIALMTLGSSGFAVQIFQLNAGRIQPDGGRLGSSAALRPGWILVLPAAAHGPGVIYGPLPVGTPVPVSSAMVPSTSATAGRPGSAHPAAGAAPAARPADQRRLPAGRSGAWIRDAAAGGAGSACRSRTMPPSWRASRWHVS
jgi:hypothetical protein